MKFFNLKSFIGGWFVGDFDPSIIKTKDFEVSVKRYDKGDSEQRHLHKLADEITVIVQGVVKMNDKILQQKITLMHHYLKEEDEDVGEPKTEPHGLYK